MPKMVEELAGSNYARRPNVAVGIDVAEARKGLDLVALDSDRRVVASVGKLTVADAARIVLSELQPAIVCIDSPSGWSISGKSRVAERELHGRGINVFFTPGDPGDHKFYRWMRVGFSIYEALSAKYSLFRGGSPAGTAAEVFPHASSVLLAGGLPPAGVTKNAFRRNVLSSHGVRGGELPNLDRVDAALGALTGTLALEGSYATVGDTDEGVILLPGRNLPRWSLERALPSSDTKLGRVSPVTARTGPNPCLCGCGAAVRRRFQPGHDAKLKSRLMRKHRAGNREATQRLKELGWID